MDVARNRHWRPVLVVVCFLHGTLIVVLLRAKPAYRAALTSGAFTTLCFINPEPRRVALPSLRNFDTPPLPGTEWIRALPPASVSSSDEPGHPPDSPTPATTPSVDWFAEAQRSAADVVGHTAPDKAVPQLPSPQYSAPWDPHPYGVEATGHGLKLRIIGPCYSDLDLGQTVYGAEARLQLGCTLGKEPARGDLFESIATPRPTE